MGQYLERHSIENASSEGDLLFLLKECVDRCGQNMGKWAERFRTVD